MSASDQAVDSRLNRYLVQCQKRVDLHDREVVAKKKPCWYMDYVLRSMIEVRREFETSSDCVDRIR